MSPSEFTFGFRVLDSAYEERRSRGPCRRLRRLCSCDERAECHREAYLSAFTFDDDFRRHLAETGSTAGFSGPCWTPWVWFDIDRPDLDAAQRDAARLALSIDERYCPGDDDLLIFFSGSKGFHIGLPTCLWTPTPSVDFHRVARRFAESAAEAAAVTTDGGVYDRVRLFRAPNSRHPKTGLHKRRLSLDELANLKLDAILSLAKEPAPFDVPTPAGTSDQAAVDWRVAAAGVAEQSEAKVARRAAGAGATLNRSTLEFIRDGAVAGDRHRMLFSAAANLAEFGCPPSLAVALLEESALDSGLPPKEVRRQIECGLAAALALPVESTHQDAPGTPQTLSGDSIPKNPLEAVTSDSGGSGGQACQQVTGATESAAPPAVLPAVVQDRPPDVQAADAPSTPPAVDLQDALVRLWAESPAPPAVPTAVSPPALESLPPPPAAPPPPSPAVGLPAAPATLPPLLPPLPPPLPPLPAGAVDSGTLDKPCRCGSTQYVDVAISGGRTRRDCRKCGRFLGWGRWYDHDEGGPAR
jgi:hypothetical protein